MAFRLWLKISKLYVALSVASERITEALKEEVQRLENEIT